MTWKFLDMEQCHRLLHSWQNTEPVPCTKMKSSDTTCFKRAWDNALHGFTPVYSSCRPRSSLTHQMPTLFSKEHVISGLHTDNLVCRWNPLDPPKIDPSDPDCRVIWPTFNPVIYLSTTSYYYTTIARGH